MKKLKENFITIGWAVKMALRINAKMFLGWGIFSVLLAVLPAIALIFNRQTVSILSDFISTGEGSFTDVLPALIALGIILTAVGVSRRISGNFLYMTMYDAYHHGMQSYYMETIRTIEVKILMQREYNEGFRAAAGRMGALTDVISSGTLFVSKMIGAISMLVVAATISLVIFIAAVVYIFVVLLFNAIAADKLRWDARLRNEAARLPGHYQWSIMQPGIAKELRIYDTGADTIEKWEKAQDRVDEFDRKFAARRDFAEFISGGGFYIFMIGMMIYSIFRVAAGAMSVDVFLMLYVMGQGISELARVLVSSLRETDRGLHMLTMQREFINSVPKTAANPAEGFEVADSEIVFCAENLCFSYDDENQVLHDLSFSIKAGETIALVGANGSGKSTLVKLLVGLFSPTDGDIEFLGNTYDEKTCGALMERVGMFFQDFYIFHATMRENVGFGDVKSIDDEAKIRRAMERGGADKLLPKLDNGLDQWLHRHIKKDGAILSGGEQQRVAVSRAYMSDKDVLIFDEPASALDPIAEMKQFHAIQEKIQGRTAILISHRVGFARLADRILVLDKGRLVETGTHEELTKSGGVYANFYREQAQWYEQV